MNNIFRTIFAVSGLLLCVSHVRAEDMDQIVCNNCASGTMIAKARDLGNGNHYFYDFVRRQLSHYLVQGITNPMAVSKKPMILPMAVNFNETVTLVPLTADEKTLFNFVAAVYDSAGTVDLTASTTISLDVNATQAARVKESMQSGISADGPHQATAFDVVSSKMVQEQAIAAALNPGFNAPFSQFAINTRLALTELANFTAIKALSNPVTLRENIKLSDGSQFVAYFDFQNQVYKYEPGSARDAAGNYIPENLAQASNSGGTGKYYYPGAEAGSGAGVEMMDHLSAMGARLSVPGGIQLNVGYMIVCTSVGGVTNCIITKLPG